MTKNQTTETAHTRHPARGNKQSQQSRIHHDESNDSTPTAVRTIKGKTDNESQVVKSRSNREGR